MHRKYLFFDIDGTLAAGPMDARYVPESTKLALRLLRENGHFTAIATGRSHAMARPIMEANGFDNMVSDGGASLVLDHELLGIKPLDREPCLRLLEECEQKGIPWAISPDDSQFRLTRTPAFEASIEEGYMTTLVQPDLDIYAVPQFNKLYLACTREEEPQLETLPMVPQARFSRCCLFIEPVDKGAGIRRIMAHLNAPLEDVVTFGDGTNDLSMFCPEWTNIAMGNARDVLKEKADYITTDADKDGIYLACKHFGWI